MDKYFADHTELFRANGWSEDKIQSKSMNIKGRFSREIYNNNQKALSNENIRNKLKNRQIWEIPFYFDTFFESSEFIQKY